MYYDEQMAILEVLESYCIDNRYADHDFIEKIVNIIVDHRKMNPLVDTIVYYDEVKDNRLGSYSYFEKMLFFSLPDQDRSVIDYNLLVLHVILHECEHVGQYQICTNGKVNAKSILLKQDLGYHILRKYLSMVRLRSLPSKIVKNLLDEKEFYEKKNYKYLDLYDISPAERMAESDSIKKLYSVLNSSDENNINDAKKGYQRLFFTKLIKDYEVIDNKLYCPTIKWYSKLYKMAPERECIKDEVNTVFSDSNYMSLNERLYLGLPINTYEHHKILKRIKNI